MDGLREYLSDLFTVDPVLADKLIASLAVVILLFLIRIIVIRIVTRKIENIRTLYNWRKSATYISVLIGFMILGRIWFAGFQSFTTYLGLLSAGIAISLKDP